MSSTFSTYWQSLGLVTTPSVDTTRKYPGPSQSEIASASSKATWSASTTVISNGRERGYICQGT